MGNIYKKWVKKDNDNTIKGVVEQNTGYTVYALKNMADDAHERRFTMPYNMRDAIIQCKRLIREGYSFVIFGDYDADGITSSAILYLGLKQLGVKTVFASIPDRLKGGYGATPAMVNRAVKKFKVFGEDKMAAIFVDNGIRCYTAVDECRKHGIYTIILDHHDGDMNILPNADVIVDSCVYSADNTQYCGAGLSFVFIDDMTRRNSNGSFYKTILPLAAIGTIADVMPLVGDNYGIVKEGLKIMNEKDFSYHEGLRMMFKSTGLTNAVIDVKDIGFTIAPIINAQSRMEGFMGVERAFFALQSYKICDTACNNMLSRCVQKMVAVNEARKTARDESVKEAEDYILNKCLFGNSVFSLYLPGTTSGIIGITAGQIAEKYNVPVFVFTDATDGENLKGSGRSCGDYNMIACLNELHESHPEYFVAYGGHPGAAGLTIKKSYFDDFARDIINVSDASFFTVPSQDVLEYDIELDADQFYDRVDNLLSEIDSVGPFGEGNPEIKFRINGINIRPNPKYKNLFQGGNSVRLYGDNNLQAIAFGFANRFSDDIRTCDIVGTLRKSFFGSEHPEIEIIDFCDTTVASLPDETDFAKKIREMSKVS